MAKDELGNEKCPKCDGIIIVREGKYGDFFSCSEYPVCKYTPPKGEIGTACLVIDENGKKCNGSIIRKPSKKGWFYGCDQYPICKFATWDKPIAVKK